MSGSTPAKRLAGLVEAGLSEQASEGDSGGTGIEIVVTAGGRPWATYSVSIDERDGRTVVDVGFASDRRFGFRRLPQRLLAQRYRDDALAAQGHAVVERDVGLSLR